MLILALTGVAWAAPPRAVKLEVTGDTVTVVRSFPVRVTAAPGADIYVWQFPDGVRGEAVDGVLTVTAAPKGTHRVTVTSLTFVFDDAAKKWNKVRDTGEATIVVGDVPAPPGPGPGPNPPAPADPLVQELKAAFLADAGAKKAEHLAALAALYRQAAAMDLGGVKTAADLFGKLQAASRALLPADALRPVRSVTGRELAAVLPSRPDETLTDAHKSAFAALAKRLGEALTEAGK